jgi:hypothetical protein
MVERIVPGPMSACERARMVRDQRRGGPASCASWRPCTLTPMNAAYFERQATAQRKKAQAELAKNVRAEASAWEHDKKALRAEKAATGWP